MEQDLLTFFQKLEQVVKKTKFGTITGNVVISNAVPKVKTFNLVISKRLRFPLGKKIDNSEDS